VGGAVRCNLCGGAVDRASCRVWSKDGHAIVRCPSCGLLFRAVLPSAGELRAIYADGYFSAAAGDTRGQGYLDYLGDESQHRATARRRLRLLAEHARSGPLLDVGCAAGFFLDEARRAGWPVRGVDVSSSMTRFGREALGLDLTAGRFGEQELPAGEFACVTMWDYIEHSTDPAGDVAEAARILRPGGVLALSTGDAGSLVARVSGRRWHLLTPRHHNFFFTARTLARLIEGAGLRVVRRGHPGARYSLRYLAHKARTLSDSALVRRAASAFDRRAAGRVAVPVNLWDILTVIAVKERA
jgi:2-polyprenyl-3-methyl-5-hydroxy-6-metoxy-1,4-benzoquinol methylase